MLELQRIPDEEDRHVVADDVVVALRGVEPQREPARVAPGVGAAALPGHRGEPDQRLRLGPGLEHRRPGVGAHIVGHLEGAERATTLGMRLTLRDPLPIEIRHLLNQIMVLQQNRTIRPDGQRKLITRYRNTRIRRGRPYVSQGCNSYLFWTNRVVVQRLSSPACPRR